MHEEAKAAKRKAEAEENVEDSTCSRASSCNLGLGVVQHRQETIPPKKSKTAKKAQPEKLEAEEASTLRCRFQ
eukprot:6086428-Amphidinium_carterae.2